MKNILLVDLISSLIQTIIEIELRKPKTSNVTENLSTRSVFRDEMVHMSAAARVHVIVGTSVKGYVSAVGL